MADKHYTYKRGRGFVWTTEQEELLKNNYSADKKLKLISELNRPWKAITKKAAVLGLTFDNTQATYHRVWTQKDEDYLVENYDTGNLKEIATKLNRTKKAVTERAKLLNLRRDEEVVRLQNHKYSINENFFKTWSSEMAYILGFIWTDGNMSDNDYCVNIVQHKKDKYILDDIYMSLKSNRPVKTQTNKDTLILDINNKIIYEDLAKLGLTPRKSKTIDMPVGITPAFMPDFLRGSLDGDGSVNYKQKRLKFCTASEQFAVGICDMLNIFGVQHKVYNNPYIIKNGKLENAKKWPNEAKTNFYSVCVIRKESVKRIYDLMYSSPTLFLKRKKESFEKMGIF